MARQLSGAASVTLRDQNPQGITNIWLAFLQPASQNRYRTCHCVLCDILSPWIPVPTAELEFIQFPGVQYVLGVSDIGVVPSVTAEITERVL